MAFQYLCEIWDPFHFYSTQLQTNSSSRKKTRAYHILFKKKKKQIENEKEGK